jgi:hypothetical protein
MRVKYDSEANAAYLEVERDVVHIGRSALVFTRPQLTTSVTFVAG